MANVTAKTLMAVSACAFLACSLSGCGCEWQTYPEDHVERMEKEGISLVGESEEFRVQVKHIYCKHADDGLLGGSAEEPTFSVGCSGGSDKYVGSFERGDAVDYTGIFKNTDSVCFYSGVMAVTCQKGSAVVFTVNEEDDWSSAETGKKTIPWEMIEYAYHGMHFTFNMDTHATGKWDTFWAETLAAVGGICISDFIPGTTAAKAARMSAKAVKMIKKANKQIKRIEKAQDKLDKCAADGLESCGDAAEVMDAIWSLQCYEEDPGGGTYKFIIQVSPGKRNQLALISIAVLALAVTIIILRQ